jgi:transposase
MMNTIDDNYANTSDNPILTDLESANNLIAKLLAENADLKRVTEAQKEQLRILRAREFGQSSEKRTVEDIRQGQLFNEAEVHSTSPDEELVETVRVTKTVYTRKKKSGRKPMSASLARIDVVVDISEEEKNTVPQGYELKRIGEDTNEQVHEIPQKYVVIRTVRPKYIIKPVAGSGLPKTEGPVRILIAPVPARILPRSIATPSLLTSVLIGKFCYALPFYRQERIFSRFGLDISRQDMSNWTIAISKKLELYIALLKAELLSGPYLHSDETYFQVMDEEGKANATKSYMWVLTGGSRSHRVVLYNYNATREADFISNFLVSYQGFLQTDGYAGYNDIGKKEGIIHVACWAHARRYFVEAFDASFKKGSAGEIIEKIGKIYGEEKTLRKKYFGETGNGDSFSFAAERRMNVEPLLDDIKAWLDAKAIEVLPSSALGKAVAYSLNIWSALIRYLDCPFLTPDNNEAERAIRPFTVGRKNWVIAGSPRGATASATIYSLIETLKLNGLEPYYALRHILTKLPVTPVESLENLLPWNLNSDTFHDLVVEDARISLDATPVF